MAEQVFSLIVFPLIIALQSMFSGALLRVAHAQLSTYHAFRFRANNVAGRVVDYEEFTVRRPAEGRSKTLYWTFVEYKAADGRLVRAKSAGSTGIKPAVGETINVAYLPETPDRVELTTLRESWLLFGVSALVVPLIFIFFIVFRLPAGMILISVVAHGVGYWLAKKKLSPRFADERQTPR